MKVVSSQAIAEALIHKIPQLAFALPPDVKRGLEKARSCETNRYAAQALDLLLENADVAKRDCVPLCQDTGTTWVCLEVGPDILVPGNVFSQVNEAVARAYTDGRLRKSVVRDALFNRENTQDNTPAFTDIHLVDEPGACRLHIMLKGGGSDNASRVCMLAPGAGRQGIVDEVVKCVREKAANACPPLIVGVGIGGTFDKVAGLAKQALMRPIDMPSNDEAHAAFEQELLVAINATGIGAAGFGGNTTALAVRLETAPCHIAALPLAINLGCSALRRCTVDVQTIDIAALRQQSDAASYDAKEKAACLAPATYATAAASIETHDDNLQRRACPTPASTMTPEESFPLSAHAKAPNASNAGTHAPAHAQAIELQLPVSKERLSQLKVGDRCLLSGFMYTLRDAGHARLLEELHQLGHLPYNLEGQTIFYAGPTPAAAGRPFGAIGPTTSSRMDFAAPELYRAGIAATVGKGHRSARVVQALAETGCVYFAAVGGAAAALARCVVSEEVISYADLGTEALRKIEVKDFPVFVALDHTGECLYV